MKNSNDTTGNRTRDLPTCGAVSQPTAPPSTAIAVTIFQLFDFMLNKAASIGTWNLAGPFLMRKRASKVLARTFARVPCR